MKKKRGHVLSVTFNRRQLNVLAGGPAGKETGKKQPGRLPSRVRMFFHEQDSSITRKNIVFTLLSSSRDAVPIALAEMHVRARARARV